MAKLFTFDLDGTLLNSKSQIPQATINAILELKKEGNYFALATGRGLISIKPILEQFSDFDFAICNNGVIVKNLKTNEVSVNSHLDNELLDIIWEESQKTQSFLTISTDQNVYTIKPESEMTWLMSQEEMDLKIGRESNIEKVKEQLNKKEKITQLALRNSEEVITEIFQRNKSTLGKKYATFQTNRIFYDINPLGSDKVNGLKKVAQILNIKPENLVTFGDSGNDIEMLSYSKYGIAMGNSTEEIKKIAYEVIGDHNTNTLAETLLRFKNSK
ncbi:HAD family hydrolase [Mycoplasma iguanae]|uniref:HAD family hydrolase n=1 Tax=Mycoplasma iguanae TaxID=292461 RepID=A0ABY5R879_9MOLU|nr:HAD family hydrolase [Mycoplasma iguanae]UVD81713.1 HAD family hydrolase [Mycoplasma iguanae]